MYSGGLNMNPTKTSSTSYHEMFMPVQKDPLTVLQNLISASLVSDYILYESEDIVRIAGNALAQVTVTKEEVCLNYLGEKVESLLPGDPIKQVEFLFGKVPIQEWTAYGYVGFDTSGFYYPYTKMIAQPVINFFIPEIEVHIGKDGIYLRSVKPLIDIQQLIFKCSNISEFTPTPSLIALSNGHKSLYESKVKSLISAINRGDLTKAIISRSIKYDGNMNNLATYSVASKNNNSARSYCLKIGEISAVGFSPEIFMESKENGFIFTNPLAGTRPRGSDAETDLVLCKELNSSAKEVKEHSLSILLAQCEVLSFCVPETVRIQDFMEIKKYRYVQHLSSRVGGKLKENKTLWDAMKVLFPGITVSGINKKQALAWIDELEDEPRGLYGGAIGWVDSKGGTDLAIAIRSIYQYKNQICFNAGAGIVGESIPEHEYFESVNKMSTMLSALVLHN
jgi:salicylate synthetase